jgi:chemotaxis protein methyltransferase CheR
VLPGQLNFEIDQNDFQSVREAVYQHCGISLPDEKISLVRARIARQVRTGGYDSARDYLDRVLCDRSGPLFSEFIDAISTNLTSFFREPDHFTYLTETIMPVLLQRKKQARDPRILAWSAACSSGEEPCSMAMAMHQAMTHLPEATPRCNVRILATDISTRMLAIARRGVYGIDRLSSVPAEYRARYFAAPRPEQRHSEPGEMVCAISATIREMVRCRYMNLNANWPFDGRFDVIFCRNVMIYFDRPTQQRLIDRFCRHLVPGGYLFTGHSESLTGIRHGLVHRHPSIYQMPDGAETR